jgi:hypothetical protein
VFHLHEGTTDNDAIVMWALKAKIGGPDHAGRPVQFWEKTLMTGISPAPLGHRRVRGQRSLPIGLYGF